MSSIYADLIAEGDDPSAPTRIRVQKNGDRAVSTLDEPDRLNVLSAAMVRQLKHYLADLAADPAIRSLVLTGAGRGFSAGGDLRMMGLAEDRLADPG